MGRGGEGVPAMSNAARRRDSLRRERGFALLLVLWLGVLVSVMAAGFAFSARMETRIGRSALDRAEVEFLADAAVKRAALGLLAPVRDQRFKADGREYPWQFAGANLSIQLMPESAKLDINRAPEALIEGLFEAFVEDGLIDEGQAESLTDAILDWRDTDKNKRSSGAENATYSSLGRPHGAANRPLLTVSEIGQVLGMNAEIVDRLTPLVTVYARSARIDAMTAPRDVLRALPGVTPEQVDEFLSKRAQVREELIEQDRDKTPTDSAGERERTGSGSLQRGRRGPPIELLGAQARRYLSRGSTRVYTVRIRGTAPRGAPVRRDAIMRLPGRNGEPYSLLTLSNAYSGD